MLVFSTWQGNMVLEARDFKRTTVIALLSHVVPFIDWKRRLKIPLYKGRCARNAPPHNMNTRVFKSD